MVRERDWRARFLHDRDGALTDERDRYSIEAHAVATDSAGAVGGPQESGFRRLVGCSLRHDFSERTLLLEQSELSLSDQDVGFVAELLGLFHEELRRLPHRLRASRISEGSIAQRKRWARTASVRS